MGCLLPLVCGDARRWKSLPPPGLSFPVWENVVVSQVYMYSRGLLCKPARGKVPWELSGGPDEAPGAASPSWTQGVCPHEGVRALLCAACRCVYCIGV